MLLHLYNYQIQGNLKKIIIINISYPLIYKLYVKEHYKFESATFVISWGRVLNVCGKAGIPDGWRC